MYFYRKSLYARIFGEHKLGLHGLFLKKGTQNWVGREGVDAGRAGLGKINVQAKSSKK